MTIHTSDLITSRVAKYRKNIRIKTEKNAPNISLNYLQQTTQTSQAAKYEKNFDLR